ncbi:hypothetical protein CWE34_17705 [Bacillus sp. SN10]|nr:hypothetical protein CWE34_17705 [Bacillus sp. SN10]
MELFVLTKYETFIKKFDHFLIILLYNRNLFWNKLMNIFLILSFFTLLGTQKSTYYLKLGAKIKEVQDRLGHPM